MGILIVIFSFISFCSNEIVHEYHLSNTEVRYNERDKALQITTRIFIDDFEETLGNQGYSGLFLCTEKEPSHADSLVANYLFDNIFINVDEKEVEFSYLGKEISDDLIAMWCYLEIEDVTPIESIEVENKVLLETFDDQKNLVTIKLDSGNRQMFILEDGNTKGKLGL